MKAFLFPLLMAAMVLTATSCSSTKATPEAISKITKQVEEKSYTIDVSMANPMRGKAIPLSYSYQLTVKGDSAYAHLPYYGVAQRAPYGDTDGGIKFDEPMKDYTITPNKKNNGWDISFKVDSKSYGYEFFLSLFNNGSASFTVNSVDRDIISFTGKVKK